MAIPIPPDFNYRNEHLDIIEQMVRDAFQLNVENWAKFRSAIHIGNDSSNLQGVSVSDDVKAAYRELGKCHYEVVSSLGFCKLAMFDMTVGGILVVKKAIKDFYFHGGSLLDNLSRIIYIINIADATFANTKKTGMGDYARHAITRGKLLDKKYASDIAAYLPHIDSPLIDEFSLTRHAIAHYWTIPIRNGEWPRDQLRIRAFAWPYDETEYQKYSGWQPIVKIITEHFEELIRAQDAIFALLVTDTAKFEANNNVTII
jgi:hypothetical protein